MYEKIVSAGFYLKLFFENKRLIRLEPLAQVKLDPEWHETITVPRSVVDAMDAFSRTADCEKCLKKHWGSQNAVGR
jgi:hypothetical protein